MVRKLVDDKDVEVLTKRIVEGVWNKYRYPYRLGGYEIEIHIPLRTTVRDDARAFAEEKGIEIVRLRY